MREPTIQLFDDPTIRGFMPGRGEDGVPEGAFSWGGGRVAMDLAPEHECQPHLLEADRVIRLVVRRSYGEDDVVGHTLTLRFPSAEEAARFRTKVVAGGLLVGALIGPVAVVASAQSTAGSLAGADRPIVPAAEAPAAKVSPAAAATIVDSPPAVHEGSGEDARTGASIFSITRHVEPR